MKPSPLARILLFALIVLAAALAPSAVFAQTPVPAGNIIAPAQTLRVSFDASAVDADGLNAPASYKVETFRPTATGVVVTSYNVAASATSIDLPASLLPTGAFLVSTRAVNNVGESGRSNVIGPFGRGTAPTAPGNTRASVVPAAQ